MKYIISLLIIVGLGLTMSAFTPNDKGDPMRYACDDEWNEQLNVYFDYYSTISMEDLQKYGIDKHKGIYRTWSDDKKREMWEIKLNHDAQFFTGVQKEFILNVAKTYIPPTKEEILNVFTLYEGKMIFTQLAFFQPNSGSGRPGGGDSLGGDGGDCTCAPMSDWCVFSDCVATGCQASSGCGTLWMSVCEGTCQ